MIKYIERQIFILESNTQPLILDVIQMQLAMVTSPSEGCVAKLETVVNILKSYHGHLRERSLELIEMLLPELMARIHAIPIPTSNTSDIEKIQINVLIEWFRLLQRLCAGNSITVFLTQRNYPRF